MMGSPSYCYKEFMREYVRINVRLSKYEKIYTDEYLKSLNEEELENLVRRLNKSHKSYAHFTAGVAVAHCTEEWYNSCDMLNASAGAIGEFMELVGVYDPDDVDFEEE